MIVVLARGTTSEQAADVLAELESAGLRGRVIEGFDNPLIHLTEGPTRAARSVLGREVVEGLVPTSGPRIRSQGRRFYPYHFINWSSAALVLLGVLVVLAGFFPPGVGAEIDVQHPAQVDVPWYLRAPVAMVRGFPDGLAWFGGLLLLGLAAAALLLPWIDRRGLGGRAGRLALALLLGAGWLVLTWKGGPG